MKRLIALLLICALLTSCAPQESPVPSSTTEPTESIVDTTQAITSSAQTMQFSGMDDPEFLTYLEDALYEDLVTDIGNGVFVVEEVSSAYISKEYLEESAYNEKDNIYFGYTLSELNETFNGERYVFTLGDDGSTIVTEFVEYEESYTDALKTILAVGAGVVLVCIAFKYLPTGQIVNVLSKFSISKSNVSMVMNYVAPYVASASPSLLRGDVEGAMVAVRMRLSETLCKTF